MTQEGDEFLNHLSAFRVQDAFSSMRDKAWEKVSGMGLPQRTDEAFRYVSLRELYAARFDAPQNSVVHKTDIESLILPEAKDSHLVFVDGQFRPDLSDVSGCPDQVVIAPLAQAMRSHGHYLQTHFQRVVKEEKDPLALLNLALHQSGVFVYVPPRVQMDSPLHCLHVITGKQFISARHHIMLGAHSHMKWVTTQHVLQEFPCINLVMDVSLDGGAVAEVYEHLASSDRLWCFHAIRAQIKRDARLKTMDVMDGSKTTRLSMNVQLNGENAEADLNGLWILRNHQSAHAHIGVEHTEPRARSMQKFKGILYDASQSSFEGKIMVRKEAQKTEAYQLNNNLILGKAAIAHSKPNLEIFADDVKASHGATVARPDDAQLFYLESRGIPEEEARQLLMTGFYKEMLDQIPYPRLRDQLIAHSAGFKEEVVRA